MKQTVRDTGNPRDDVRAFRNALGHFPTGVTIVTTRSADGEDVGMTMNSFNAVSLDPPLILFSIDRRAHSLPVWSEAKAFGINILAEGQDALSNQFAKPLSDKWNGIQLERGLGDVALLDGAIVQLECEPYAQYPGGDHVIFIAEVRHYHVFSLPGSLAFCHGRYNHLRPGSKAPPDWPLPIHY